MVLPSHPSDPTRMLERVLSFPRMIREVLESDPWKGAQIPSPESIVLVGMGGSAIAGDYLQRWVAYEGRVPFVVVREHSLPSFVGERTLVLAISYSGNTEETLEAFKEGRERGALLCSISSGGRLEELSLSWGIPHARIERRIEPRASFPLLLATSALLLERVGVLPGASRRLERGASLLEREEGVEERARQLMRVLLGRIPVVYGSGFLAPVARRIASQLNENSKILSFWGELPEMGHNEIVGWSRVEPNLPVSALFLRSPLERESMRKRWEFLEDLLRRRGVPHETLLAQSDDPILASLEVTFWGDVGSVLVAQERGIDPSPVPVVEELKRYLG